MWENELIIIWFSFYLLIAIFLLLLLTLMIEHSDHRELMRVLKEGEISARALRFKFSLPKGFVEWACRTGIDEEIVRGDKDIFEALQEWREKEKGS